MGQYETLLSVYEHYKKAELTITFEDRQYKFKGITRANDVSKHAYRNEEEQHTLLIHMHNNQPFYVDAFYSVKGAL